MKFFKKPIFVSISPNAQVDDVWLALKLIFSPWRWQKGEAVQKFTNELKSYLPIKYAFTFDSGRTALLAVLKALDIKEGDEILIQAFTCTAAVNPILWVGAKPIYVDIEEGTYNMSPLDLLRKISSKSRAVIVQHTFGLPADFDEILEIARKNNLLVIEDVAHSLGAEWRNKKLGTFGDAAILSFGRFKIISAVFAGAAATNNPKIAKNIEKFYKECDFPSRFWIFQQLFHPLFLSIAKPLYNIFSLGKVLVVIAKKMKLISLTVYSEEKSGGRPGFGPSRMPNTLAILGLNQLQKLERYNKHRIKLAEIYKKELGLTNEAKLPQELPNSKQVYLYFPIQLQNDSLVYKLIGLGRRSEGIYLENWPAKKVIGPQGTNLEKLQYKMGSCPIAEEVAPRTIVLPTNPNTREQDAGRVARFIKSFLKIQMLT
ncbi:MAG: DegT/DnrJ/EryC1/StrS family aminotransferase [Candidatus Colwellbacteria bacterium]|nr:DegT/DnrJ/EryC1/StrS family aminotransferase [Candidatus Colwellbacteria bacterium]